MLDVCGLELSSEERRLLASPVVGGLILFARNYQDPEQLRSLIADIRQCAPEIIIAVDHEGGRVQRFKEGFTKIPSMGSLDKIYKIDPQLACKQAKELGWLFAAELASFDIDISFAPVLDRDYGVSEVIGDRAFSADSQSIIEMSTALIEGMREAGMASTGKHFPGHGAVAADSHLEIPVDKRSLADIKHNDMSIFASVIDKGLDAIMPAHVIYEQIDDSPAGFSQTWMKDILRNELSFDGVIFSDDLSMEGATVAGGFTQRADAAISAGCDMVLVCNNPAAAEEVRIHLESKLECGELALDNPRLRRMRLDREKQKTLKDVKESDIWKKYNQENATKA
jgi:beta-N-acetylhexosaminidase